MRVYLCRHAHADPGDPDELRPLSAKGEEQARALAARLAGETERPRLVLSSPLLRARQTASTVADASGGKLEVDERLAPGATAAALGELLRDRGGPVATVGHQPDCSEIALALVGSDPGFQAGGMLELDLPEPGDSD